MNDELNINQKKKENWNKILILVTIILFTLFISLIIIYFILLNSNNKKNNINNNEEKIITNYSKNEKILYKINREDVPYNKLEAHHTYINDEINMTIAPKYSSKVKRCSGSNCVNGYDCTYLYGGDNNGNGISTSVDSCFLTISSNLVSISLTIGYYNGGIREAHKIYTLYGKFDDTWKTIKIYDHDNFGYNKNLEKLKIDIVLYNKLYKKLLEENIEYVLFDPENNFVYDLNGKSIIGRNEIDLQEYSIKEESKEESKSENKIKLAEDIDLKKQREKYNNQDIIGRVEFPGLINELVLRGTDNNYYRIFNIEHQPYEKGSEPIFMDYRVSPQSRQINLYNVNKEVSFPKLSKYLDEEYFKNNPYIVFQHDSGKRYYKIISIKNVSSKNNLEFMNFDYTDESFISHMKKIISGYGLMYSRDIEIKDDSNFLVVQSNINDSLIIFTAIEIDNIE